MAEHTSTLSEQERKAKNAAYMREWNRRNPDKVKAVRDKRRDSMRDYDRWRYQLQRKQILEQRRLARLADPDKFRERDKVQYRKDPAGKVRKGRERRQAYRAAHPLPPRVLDQSVFDTVTEESAYWIGFLMADGCIFKQSIRLALKNTDAEHVAAFASFLKCDRLPRPTKKDQVQFCVHSRRLVTAVARFGLVPRKSKVAKVMGLENDRHFWRGVIDGDGWVSLRKKPKDYPIIGLCGSEALVTQFRNYAAALLDGKTNTLKPMRSIWAVSFAGSFALPVIHNLYGSCTIALPRKLESAQRAMNRTFHCNAMRKTT